MAYQEQTEGQKLVCVYGSQGIGIEGDIHDFGGPTNT